MKSNAAPSRIFRKLRTFIIYVIVFDIVRKLSDLLLPNAHVFNIIRGVLFSPFFAECGRGVAIASGCIFNGAWNLRIERDAYIAHNCWINAVGGLIIEERAILSPNVVMATSSHGREFGGVSLRVSRAAPIRIGKGAWVSSNCVITMGSEVGSGAIVGAGSVVRGQLQPNAFYAGAPAKLVKVLPT